jgi:hypothetical protein
MGLMRAGRCPDDLADTESTRSKIVGRSTGRPLPARIASRIRPVWYSASSKLRP